MRVRSVGCGLPLKPDGCLGTTCRVHMTLTFDLDLGPSWANVSNGTSTCDGAHLCQIILKYIHNCKSYGQKKIRRMDARTNACTHIHRTVIVTTMSRSLQQARQKLPVFLYVVTCIFSFPTIFSNIWEKTVIICTTSDCDLQMLLKPIGLNFYCCSNSSQTSPGFYMSAVHVFWKHCGNRSNCS